MFFFVLLVLLGTEPRTWCISSKHSTTELHLHPYDITFSSGGTGAYYITLAASNKQPGWPGTIYLPLTPNARIKSEHPHHYSVAQFALFYVHTGRCDHC